MKFVFIYIRDINEDFGMDFVTNDLKQRTLESINNQAEDARQKMYEKRTIYEASMKKYGIFSELKEKAFTIFQSYKNTSKEEEFKTKYQNAQKSLFEAESDSDILRDSLRSSISFCSKMNESAFIANSILG
ncbi:MAG TPA: hypothetical protein PLG15_03210 [Candidatus Gastranaerophilaceae bacterium]|nr:hypothetical protein [Candidatus Gastranaerophilaceae bacterium]HPT41373.1 hypothetical protein [Candidatus Gastranaerophilaceae bacterium]